MSIPIGLSDIFKIFEFATGRRDKSRDRVIEWLDAVYSDLEELSQLWVKIMADTESADARESKQALDILFSRGFNENLHKQKRIVGRLNQFYLSATEVIGGSHNGLVPDEYRDLFIFKLGSILAARLKSRNVDDDHWRFRGLAGPPVSLSLEDAYANLQEELVSLQVLIRNFKSGS